MNDPVREFRSVTGDPGDRFACAELHLA